MPALRNILNTVLVKIPSNKEFTQSRNIKRNIISRFLLTKKTFSCFQKPLKKTFLFTIAYYGKPYHGNTYQPNARTNHLPTVEKEILHALGNTLLGKEKIPIKIPVPSDVQKQNLSKYQIPTIKRTSRTDKGVSCKIGKFTITLFTLFLSTIFLTFKSSLFHVIQYRLYDFKSSTSIG